MMYDFVFTFEIVDCTEEEKANAVGLLIESKINFSVYETINGYRFITIGSTRRRIENVMCACNGRHLRMLDDYTYSIMCDLIETFIEEVEE